MGNGVPLPPGAEYRDRAPPDPDSHQFLPRSGYPGGARGAPLAGGGAPPVVVPLELPLVASAVDGGAGSYCDSAAATMGWCGLVDFFPSHADMPYATTSE